MPILYFQHFATQKCIWHFQSSQSTYYQLKLNANPKCDDITMTVLFSSTFLKSYQNSPTIMLLTNENVVENCSSFHFKLSLPIKLSKMCCFDLQTLQKNFIFKLCKTCPNFVFLSNEKRRIFLFDPTYHFYYNSLAIC